MKLLQVVGARPNYMKVAAVMQAVQELGTMSQLLVHTGQHYDAAMDAAKVVLTDSGGIQEETTALGVPCLTLRHNTERPITCEVGSNLLVGHDRQKIRDAIASVMAGTFPSGRRPEMWNGRAGAHIAAIWSGSALDRAA